MDRKVAESILRERNMPTFKRLGFMEPPFFKIKMSYIPKDRIVTQPVVGMFESELKRPEGVYIELTDGENLPLNDVPTLYFLPYNPDFRNVYIKHDEKPGMERFLVYLDYLQLVDVPTDKKEVVIEAEEDYNDDEEYQDCHMNELTARDRACIDLKIPESNKKWLNDLIKKANKN